MRGLHVDIAKHRPRRREPLYTSTVRGRLVVLDPVARTLIELHPDIASLWPLLDGHRTLGQLAAQWELTADVPCEEGQRIVESVLDELAARALLASAEN